MRLWQIPVGFKIEIHFSSFSIDTFKWNAIDVAGKSVAEDSTQIWEKESI
jgi:hypothetical protein